MNKTKVIAVIALTLGTAAGFVLGQTNRTKHSSGAAAAPSESQQMLARVATLYSIAANSEFQRNVQIMQAERQRVVNLMSELEKSTNPTDRRELQRQVDEAMAKLNDDNRKMVEAYGFSLNRNYTLVVERAHIFMFVSPEEAAEIEARQAANP